MIKQTIRLMIYVRNENFDKVGGAKFSFHHFFSYSVIFKKNDCVLFYKAFGTVAKKKVTNQD